MALLESKHMAIEQPVSAPVAHMVSIKEIVKATWNPKSRVSERRLLQLRLSMDDLGLYYPVLIDEKKHLIDGHRRLAVAESFGWKRIPAITINGAMLQSYGSVQLTQQKLSGNDMLGVYLEEPNALLGKQRVRMVWAEKVIGRPLMRQLYEAGQSVAIVANAFRVAKYIGIDDVRGIAAWLSKHRLGVISPLMKGGMPPAQIKKYYLADKPIIVE